MQATLFSLGWRSEGNKLLGVHSRPLERETCFARPDSWLPNVDLHKFDEEEGKRELLLEYLGCHGPVSTQDFAYWGGLLASETRRTCEDLVEKLVGVQVEGSGRSFLRSRQDLSMLDRIDEEELIPAHLLPRFNSCLVGYNDRTRIIAPEPMKRIYVPNGNMAPSIFVDGRVAGTWGLGRMKSKLTVFVEPFAKFDEKTFTELDNMTDGLGDFMKAKQSEMVLKQSASR